MAGVVRRVLLCTLLALAPALASAHPIHTTLTVLTFDADRRTITLSIRVFADDFSAAVARAAGKPVPRDSSVTGDDVTRYVRARFGIEGVVLEPCGVQRSGEAYLLCFRAAIPRGAGPLRARNVMLTELHGDQVNVVQVSVGGSRTTRVFTAGSGMAPIVSP